MLRGVEEHIPQRIIPQVFHRLHKTFTYALAGLTHKAHLSFPKLCLQALDGQKLGGVVLPKGKTENKGHDQRKGNDKFHKNSSLLCES